MARRGVGTGRACPVPREGAARGGKGIGLLTGHLQAGWPSRMRRRSTASRVRSLPLCPRRIGVVSARDLDAVEASPHEDPRLPPSTTDCSTLE